MIRKSFNAEGGFTLIESVLAVVILGFALGACVLTFSMGMRTVSTAANQMAALHTTRYELEILRTGSLTNSTTVFTAGSHNFTNGSVIGSFTVTNIDSCTKNVTVSVPYLNRIHGGYSTNSITTSLTTTLHP